MAKQKTKNNPNIVLNEEVFSPFTRLSESGIFGKIKQYYKDVGKDAWKAYGVPNFVTTNSSIAHSYARVMLSMVQDWQKQNTSANNDEPIYIIELGAGSGRFAHYFLHHFFKALDNTQISQKVVYVMSDISEANIGFWAQHQKFKPFVDAGQLDFSYLDLWEDDEVHLRQSGKVISKKSITTPIGLIANYVFDSVPVDLFSIKDGVLYEKQVRTKMDEKNKNVAAAVDKAELSYRDIPCSLQYYGREDLDNILSAYVAAGDDFHFSVPVGASTGLERLAKLTTGPIFALASDFGDTSLESAKTIDDQRGVSKEIAFVVRVNFDGVGRFCKANGGAVLKSPHTYKSIATVGLLLGSQLSEFRGLEAAFEEYIVDFGPDDFYAMKHVADGEKENHSFEHIMAILRLSKWDSMVFKIHFEALNEIAGRFSRPAKLSVRATLDKIEKLYFDSDPDSDILLQIANIKAKIGDYEESLILFEGVTKVHGTTANNQYFMGLLNWKLDKKEQAIECMEEAIKLNAKLDHAKEALAKYRADFYSS